MLREKKTELQENQKHVNNYILIDYSKYLIKLNKSTILILLWNKNIDNLIEDKLI
jgi:hypothetical protein